MQLDIDCDIDGGVPLPEAEGDEVIFFPIRVDKHQLFIYTIH